MERKSLRTITMLSILLSFVFTGGIFAYWASLVAGDATADNPQITIGVGESVQTTLSLAEAQRTQGSLVPVGYEKAGSVSEIIITYEVVLEATEDGSQGAFAVLTATHGVLPNTLLVVEITLASDEIVAGGDLVEVFVSIKLTEPQNYDEYMSVANTTFDIPLTFTATI